MDALRLGRRTYQIFADYWPGASEEIPFTGQLNGVPKFVASRTLAGPLAWRGSTLVAGGLVEGVTAVKERHDEVHVIGSLDLVLSPLRFGFVDRLSLWLYHAAARRWQVAATVPRSILTGQISSAGLGKAVSPRLDRQLNRSVVFNIGEAAASGPAGPLRPPPTQRRGQFGAG